MSVTAGPNSSTTVRIFLFENGHNDKNIQSTGPKPNSKSFFFIFKMNFIEKGCTNKQQHVEQNHMFQQKLKNVLVMKKQK